MKDTKFVKHYKRQLANFFQFFDRTLDKQKMEDVHQMRVSIKKLRAMWSLIQMVNQDQWQKKVLSDLVRELFSEAGHLREAQVNLELVQATKKSYLQPYKKYLKKSQKRSTKKLVRRMRTFKRKKFDRLNDQLLAMMKKIPDDLLVQEAAVFVFNRIKKVRKIKKYLPNEEKLHDIRKEQKVIQEVLNIIRVLSPENTLDHLRLQVKSFNQRIGQWHDYCVLNHSLKIFLKTNRGQKERKKQKKYLKRIHRKQKASQKKIQKMLNKYMAQHQVKRLENLL